MGETQTRKRNDIRKKFRDLETGEIVERFRGGPGFSPFIEGDNKTDNHKNNNGNNNINGHLLTDEDVPDARQRGFINRARDAAYGAQEDSLVGVRVTNQMYEMAEIASTAWRLISERLRIKQHG